MENLTRENQILQKLEEETNLEESKLTNQSSPQKNSFINYDNFEINHKDYNLKNEMDILKANYDSDSNIYYKNNDEKLNIDELVDENIKNNNDLLDLKRQLNENSKKNIDNNNNDDKKNEKVFNPIQSVISEVSENKEVSVINENELSSKNPFQNSINNNNNNEISQDDFNFNKTKIVSIEETKLLKENLKKKNENEKNEKKSKIQILNNKDNKLDKKKEYISDDEDAENIIKEIIKTTKSQEKNKNKEKDKQSNLNINSNININRNSKEINQINKLSSSSKKPKNNIKQKDNNDINKGNTSFNSAKQTKYKKDKNYDLNELKSKKEIIPNIRLQKNFKESNK